MANLIVVCGPQAVGKMTVAEALRDKIKYNLMINHDSIEVSDKIFGFGTIAQKEFNQVFREKAFEIAVKNNVDLIFTFVCAFDLEEDINYLKNLEKLFTKNNGEFYFVELSANLETRLYRNETPHRMEMKASKKDINCSKNNLLNDAKEYKLNTDKDQYLFKHHLKIDNTNLKPEEVADIIIKEFKIIPNQKEENEYKYVL